MEDDTRLVAVVAGGSRGAGRGSALALAEIGAVVYIAARSTAGHTTFPEIPSSIDDAAQEVERRGGRSVPVACDFADDDAVAALFARVRREQGRLDVLVNSAWGGEGVRIGEQPFWKLPEVT